MSNPTSNSTFRNPHSSKWHRRFLELAKHISSWSQDPSTKVGAVCINAERRILSMGYNGFPTGIEDSKERYDNRAEKYKYIVHAEMNAIYNAISNGVSLRNSTMYVSGLCVCSECAKGIIQSGITTVVMDKHTIPDAWKASCDLATDLFKEARIQTYISN